jgi:hypothetical protein
MQPQSLSKVNRKLIVCILKQMSKELFVGEYKRNDLYFALSLNERQLIWLPNNRLYRFAQSIFT